MKYLILFFLPLLSHAAGKIINADIAPSGTANIALNKLAASTANNVCTFDASGYIAGGVAAGSLGNYLKSNGTTWTSASPGNLTAAGTDGIAVTAGTGAVFGAGTSIAQQVADATHNGYLSSTDWNTFNGKQSTISLAAFGSSPNANGATFSSNTLTLQPASASFPGGVTTGAQGIAGVKTFSSEPIAPSYQTSAAGSTGTPNFYTPTGSGNAGMYWDGVNGLSLTYNGTRVFSLVATQAVFTQKVSMANGAVNAPSLYWSDAGTGFYRIGTNNLGLTINSTKLIDYSAASVAITGAFSVSGTTTLATSLTGLLKATSGVVSTASSGTDYAPATSGTSILKGNGSGGFSNAASGTDYAPATSGTSILYGNGSGGFSNVSVGSGLTFAGGTLSASGSTSNSNDNMVYVDSGNGHGATNTTVRRYSKVHRLAGLITYADSAANGATFTVATGGAGGWLICANERRSGAQAYAGITVNSASLTTAIASITYANGFRAMAFVGSNSETADVCTVEVLADGDVVRMQDSGNENATNSLSSFMMVRLGTATSQVSYYNGNGYGATDTMIRNYSNRNRNSGTDITGASSGNNGVTLTANANGMYIVCRGDGGSASGIDMGFSLNSSAKTTDIFSLTYAQGKRSYLNNPTANGIRSQCYAAPLSTNDVIRAQDDGSANDTSVASYITMIKIDDGVTTDHIFLDTGGGAGSLQTKKYYLTAQEAMTGTGASYDNSTLNGTTYTINDPGIYMTCLISWVDSGPYYSSVEVGQNPAYTTSVSTPLEYVNGVRNIHIAGASNSGAQSCFAQYLDRGQTYSFHSDGGTPRTVDSTISFLTRIK